MKLEICPKCFGSKENMEGKKNKKGFEYKKCNLCKGKGEVHPEIAEDYIFSLNEDNFEENDD